MLNTKASFKSVGKFLPVVAMWVGVAITLLLLWLGLSAATHTQPRQAIEPSGVLAVASQPADPISAMNSKCAPPCWGGITPGSTKEQEVTAILSKLPGYQRVSGSPHGELRIWHYWNSGVPDSGFGENWNGVRIQDGVALEIVLSYPDVERVTVGDLLDKYGRPDKEYFIVQNGNVQNDMYGYAYLSKGLFFHTAFAPDPPVEHPSKGPNRIRKIIQADYFAPTDFSSFIRKFYDGIPAGFSDPNW